MSRLTVFSVASALLSVTQARYSNDVSDALAILQGLSANLAGPFCSSFNGGETTTTVTIGASTVTVAMEPPCSETEGYPIWQTTIPDAPDYPVATTSYGGYAVYSPAPAEAAASIESSTVGANGTPLFSSAPVPDGEDFPDDSAPIPDGEDFPDDSAPNADGEDFPDDSAPNADGEDFPDDSAPDADDENSPGPTPGPTPDDESDAAALDEVIITLTTTTTIFTTTFSTTTVFPDATGLAAAEPLKRSLKILSPRAQWCADIDRPCRLATYSDAIIADACGQYLGDDAEIEAAVVTVTTTMSGAVETVSVCGTVGEYPQYNSGPNVTEEDYPQYTDETASYTEETPYYSTPTYEEYTTSTPNGYKESTPTPAYVSGSYTTPSEEPASDDSPVDAGLASPLASPSAALGEPLAFPADGDEDGVPATDDTDDTDNPMDDDDLEMTPGDDVGSQDTDESPATNASNDAIAGEGEDMSNWTPSSDDGTIQDDNLPDWVVRPAKE